MAFTPDDSQATTTHEGGIRGAAPKRTVTRQQLVDLPPSSDFRLMVHPARWQHIEGWGWLPLPGKLTIEPGIGGVDHKGQWGTARDNYEQMGWRVLRIRDVGEYVQRFEGRRGPVHLEKWAVVKAAGGRTVIKADRDGYYAFLQSLIDEGYCEPADPDILALVLEAKAARIERIEGRAVMNPGLHGKIEREKAKLEDMREDVELTTQATTSKATAPRGPTKKELLARCEELGLKVSKRWTNAKLAGLIAKADEVADG